MLALTLTESLSMLGGLVVLVLALILILRPFHINVTIHHEKEEHDDDNEE